MISAYIRMKKTRSNAITLVKVSGSQVRRQWEEDTNTNFCPNSGSAAERYGTQRVSRTLADQTQQPRYIAHQVARKSIVLEE